MSSTAGDVSEQVADSKTLEVLARVGMGAYGVTHILVGWLAILMAWGESTGESPTFSGALGVIAEQPLGRIMLWIVAGGLVALAIWQASEVIWGHHTGGDATRRRLTSGAKAVVYVFLGFQAARVAAGGGASSGAETGEATSGVLALPAGWVLVVVAGLIVVGVGVAGVVKGVTRTFLEDIDTSSMSTGPRQAAVRLGQIGYIAKGLAIAAVGGLLMYATATFEPQMQGLDGALQTILAQPFGSFLLTFLALGFVAFGIFAMLQSWYRRM